jgi:uncharacterized protein (DUF736 family)
MPGKPLENKPGKGVLFHRRAEGNQPTLRGGVNIDGTEYELAGWEQTSKSGTEYISLSIKPARAAQSQPLPEMRGRWQP